MSRILIDIESRNDSCGRTSQDEIVMGSTEGPSVAVGVDGGVSLKSSRNSYGGSLKSAHNVILNELLSLERAVANFDDISIPEAITQEDFQFMDVDLGELDDRLSELEDLVKRLINELSHSSPKQQPCQTCQKLKSEMEHKGTEIASHEREALPINPISEPVGLEELVLDVPTLPKSRRTPTATLSASARLKNITAALNKALSKR